MGQKIITLSGAATDVLYALFFRGALQSGDLPAKSGAAELRELGFAETRHTATEYQKENYFTFLTAEGQEFAIKHLVNTRFGVPAGGYIGSPLNALDEIADLPRYKISSEIAVQQKIADALDTGMARYYEQFGNPEPDKTVVFFLACRWVAIKGCYTDEEIRDAVEHIKRLRKQKADEKAMAESSPFVMKDGQVFIKDAFIGNGIVSANYNVKLNINNVDKPHEAGMTLVVEDGQSKVEFMADRYTVHEAASSIIENAVATSAKTKIRLGDEMKQAVIDAVRESDLFASLQEKIDAKTASLAGMQQAMHDAVNDALRKALKPGGTIWTSLKRGF